MSLYVGIDNKPKEVTRLLLGTGIGYNEVTSAYTGGVNLKDLVYEDFNLDKELTKANPVKALTSGLFTKEDIGKTVYLSNSATACQEWRVADVNHDGTVGTVDLFPRYVLGSTYFCGGNNSGYASTQKYINSNLRYYLNNTLYNGFPDDIKNIMKDVFSTDKVKAPSLHEVGINYIRTDRSVYSMVNDGTVYSIFGSLQNDSNALAAYTDTSGNDAEYLTRTTGTNLSAPESVWFVFTVGGGYASSWHHHIDKPFIACIRF